MRRLLMQRCQRIWRDGRAAAIARVARARSRAAERSACLPGVAGRFILTATQGEIMIRLDPKRTALVAIDMHRGHLDPEVATLPLPAERCGPVIDRAAQLFAALRQRGVVIVHVVTEYRGPEEIAANPFWGAIENEPAKARKGMSRHNIIGGRGTEIIPALLDS